WPRVASAFWRRPFRVSWQSIGNASRRFRRSLMRFERRAFETPSSRSARTFEGSRREINSTACDIDTSRHSTSFLWVSLSEASGSWRTRCHGATETASKSRPASRSYVRQGEIHRIRAFGAEIPTLPIRIRESLGEEHHALGIRVVMAEAQGMPEFVN